MVDWNLAVNVTVTGFVLVFGMLLLLVIILMIFGFVSVALSKAKEKKAAKAKAATFADMLANSVEEPAKETLENDDEIVAIISAAVYALYSGKKVKPVIKSIKNASSRRSVWAKAGIADNTRVF